MSFVLIYVHTKQAEIKNIFSQCLKAQKGMIKMNKKLLSLFIAAAMITPAMTALADDVVLISEQEAVAIAEEAAVAMNKLTGVVASVENGIANITITDGELTADYGFGLTENTAIFTIDGKEATEVKEGDNVIVFTESSLKTKDIKSATAIVILSEENADTSVMYSTFTNTEDGFLSADGELALNLTEEEIAAYDGKDLLIFYNFTTMSIPAQTTPTTIVVFEEEAAAEEETATEDGIFFTISEIRGVVSSVENNIANITVTDGELTTDYSFGLTEKTPLLTIDGEEATELKEGDNVIVFTSSPIMTKDIKTAEAIVILSEENTTTAVTLDYFANTEVGLLSSNGQLILNVEDEKLAEYNEKNLLVFYDFATMSIPAQTNPVKVVVLEESEKMQNVEISFCIGQSILSINGNKVEVEAPYIAGEGVTLVPLRVISEAFGAQVNWDGETKTVTIAHNENNISVQIDNKTAVVNGENKTLEESPELTENGITMLPLRFISEELGATVGYEHETQAISVSMNNVAY